MRKNKRIHFRITTQQYERLKNIAEAKGFITVSEYLRYSALERDLEYEEKFNTMFNIITKKREQTPAPKKKDFLI